MSDGANLAYRPYTSPRRPRPTSVVSLPAYEPPPVFARPLARPLATSQHARSQSMANGSQSASEYVPLASGSKATSRPTSPAQMTSRSASGSPIPVSQPARPRPLPGKAPYLPGFQPAGVWRSRTDELFSERTKRGETRRMESVRIGRRLAKLIELHFPDPLTATDADATSQKNVLTRATSFRTSLAAELDLLRTKSPIEVWGRVVRGVKGAKAEDMRAAEQAIVKWQDDEAAKRCAICSCVDVYTFGCHIKGNHCRVPFSFQTRKHHCRLCGRVVCFLPPTAQQPPATSSSPALPLPVRPVRCSTFVRYEYDPLLMKDGVNEKLLPIEARGQIIELEIREGEAAPDGVRVCRECLSTVMRRQAASHPPRIPNYINMHDTLLQLQEEIEAALPELQEMIIGLSKPHPSTAAQKSALNARKKVLSALASFDSLGKRIRDLPDTIPGSARDRLQRAIAARAQLYLADKLALLKGLGFEELETPPPRVNGKSKAPEGKLNSLQKKEVEERAAKLAVLLEQEQLVQSYWEDANAKRQLEDANSLKASLTELRSEIRTLREAS